MAPIQPPEGHSLLASGGPGNQVCGGWLSLSMTKWKKGMKENNKKEGNLYMQLIPAYTRQRWNKHAVNHVIIIIVTKLVTETCEHIKQCRD